MNELQIAKSESGLLITTQDGKFVFTPTGLLNLSGMMVSSEKSSPPDVMVSPRSKRFLVSLTQNGEIFVSPAGEVDFSTANFQEKDKLIVSPAEKLVVTKDGKMEKTFNEEHVEQKVVPKLKREDSLMSHLENGEFIFCPSGSVRIPENVQHNHKPFSSSAKNWLIDLQPDGNLGILTSHDNTADIAEKWIQLF